MKIYLFLSIFLVNNTILLGLPNLTPHKNTASRESLIVAQIREVTAKKLLIEEKLLLVGSGGQMMNGIEMLALKFEYAEEVDLPKARHLLITAVQTYLNQINQSKELRRYLKPYPFTANNINIGIYVHKPDGSNVEKHKLYYISAIDGTLFYYRDNIIKNYPRILFYQESYEEAVKIMTTY